MNTAPEVLAGRYVVGPIIGQGAMGIVYRATNRINGETIALKALKPEIVAANPTLLTRFRREGEALRMLNHPNIVKILDAFEHEGRHYLVMEYVNGGSLHDLMLETPQIPLERALRLALDLADALTRAHRLNIIHRDLKPANVLIAADGTLRLTDFGIAHMADSSDVTEVGAVIGTYAYLSPESCMGEVLDPRADIWAFGVLLYEMLAGKRPFEGTSPGALITAILSAPIPDISRARSDIPEALQDLMVRMLDRNREARIPSIRLVGAELEAMIRTIETPMTATVQLPSIGSVASLDTPTPPTSAQRYNWPALTTPFIGREDALQAIDIMIDDSSCRLITLLGPGGMGKTRLALEAASRRLQVCSDNVAFVSLAPLISPNFIVPAIASAVGLAIGGQSDPKQMLLDHLRPQNLLILMDNFEHLLEGVEIINDILTAAPAVKVMATSRARLNLQAECIYEVKGMALPAETDLGNLENTEAAEMFLTYARRAKPDYQLADKERPAIAKICQLLDGMPLGLELASAWMRSLPPKEIAEELATDMDFLEQAVRDIPNRHRGMRAVFGYSWRLLNPEEQTTLKTLSVFRGGFTREAAKEIADARVGVMAKLVDHSLLLRVPEGRYHQHEMVRQYAREKLAENGEEERRVVSAHSQYYAAFLDQRKGGVWGEKQRETLADIDQEIDNLRAAWQRTIQQGSTADIARFLDDLPQFFEIRGRPQEAQDSFGWAMDTLEKNFAERIKTGGDLAMTYGRLARIRGQFAYRLAHYERATQYLEKGLEIFRTLEKTGEDRAVIDTEKGLCLNNLGNIATVARNYARAKTLFEECLAIYRKQGNERGAATVQNNLGTTYKEMGEYTSALLAYLESMSYFKQTGNEYGVAVLLDNLGYTADAMGKPDSSRSYFEEALPKAWSVKALPLVLDVLLGLAKLELASDPERAVQWAAMIRSHPAAYQEIKQKAQLLLDAASKILGADKLTENREKGEALSVDLIVEKILGAATAETSSAD